MRHKSEWLCEECFNAPLLVELYDPAMEHVHQWYPTAAKLKTCDECGEEKPCIEVEKLRNE